MTTSWWWMPGTEGQQDGLRYLDKSGREQETCHIAPDRQGCDLQNPFHFWQAMADQHNGGANDGFLKLQPEGDLFPISYHERDDLPILAALAEEYTLYDHYFSSMLGPTWPNRLHQLCATTDIDYTAHAEFNGTSNDFHPQGSIQVGQEFVAEVHDAMANNPQWERSVFIMNIAETLDFSTRRDPVTPPGFAAPAAHACDNPNHAP